jgi:GT2 family glycosyltransferase
LEILYADGHTGVVAPQLRFPPGSPQDIQPSCRRFPTYWDLFCEFTGMAMLCPRSGAFNRWKMGDFDHRSAREVDQPQGAFLLARPEVVTQVGVWDERFPLFFSDVDWCRRVWQAGWKILFAPEVFVCHAQGASVKKIKPATIWSSHVSFWRYFRKWRSSLLDEILSLIVAPLLLTAACWRIVWHFLSARFSED